MNGSHLHYSVQELEDQSHVGILDGGRHHWGGVKDSTMTGDHSLMQAQIVCVCVCVCGCGCTCVGGCVCGWVDTVKIVVFDINEGGLLIDQDGGAVPFLLHLQHHRQELVNH